VTGRPTRVLVLGAAGMLGHTLFERLSDRPGLEVHATVRDPAALAARTAPERLPAIRAGIDASRFDDLVRVVDEVRPTVLVNAIGIVKQVPAAKDPIASVEINALLPHRLARLCADRGVRLVHVSTDCVFSGMKGGGYTEDDPPDPTDLYGRTKALGEPADGRALTLRTSIVGHELGTRHGLVEWFLGQERTAPGFRRAIFSGLPTVELGRVIGDVVLLHPGLSGTYHVSSAPISKLELLEIIARQYGKRIDIVPSDEPVIDRSLDSSRFRAATGYRPPSWEELVGAMFDDASRRYRLAVSAAAGR
jgi:dTDP-4-dehydrorhamnose reductase